MIVEMVLRKYQIRSNISASINDQLPKSKSLKVLVVAFYIKEKGAVSGMEH